jgi:hypothetical protein
MKINELQTKKFYDIGAWQREPTTQVIKLFCGLSCFDGHHDIQHNDTQHNNIQHNDIQHNHTPHNDIQHNNTQQNETQHNIEVIATLIITTPSITALSTEFHYA